jgi:hypothetical protein
MKTGCLFIGVCLPSFLGKGILITHILPADQVKAVCEINGSSIMDMILSTLWHNAWAEGYFFALGRDTTKPSRGYQNSKRYGIRRAGMPAWVTATGSPKDMLKNGKNNITQGRRSTTLDELPSETS